MRRDPIIISHEIARQVHAGEFRRSGEPYIVHPEAVAQAMDTLFVYREVILRPVDKVAEAAESNLHDVIESEAKKEEKRLGRLLTPKEEERIVEQTKSKIAQAFQKGGYELDDEVSKGVRVADILYDIDSLTHRRWWRTMLERKPENAGLLKHEIKAAAYMVGHHRLLLRSQETGRMTPVKVKIGDTRENDGDNPTPERHAVYAVTLPQLMLSLASADIARRAAPVRHRHHEADVISMSKPVEPTTTSDYRRPCNREAAYG